MQPREQKILQIFVENQNKIFTSSELAFLLSISPRTIKNDIKNINDEIRPTGFKIDKKPGVGMWLDSKCLESDMLNNLEKYAGIIGDNEMYERRVKVIKYLIESKDYISTEAIAQKLYLSNSTVAREINQLEVFFKKFNITVDRKIKKGVKLLGEEKNLRIVKAEVLKNILNKKKMFDNDVQEYFPDLDIEYIEILICELQDNFSICISDLSKRGLIIHTAISITRIKNNKFVEMPVRQLEQLKSYSEWIIAEYYAKRFSKHFNIEFSEDECGYIVIHLLAANLNNKTSIDADENVNIRKLDPEVYLFMSDTLEDISIKYNFQFDKDEKLKRALFLHIKPMLNRLSNSISLNNPWVSEMKHSNAYSFEIATYLANCLSDKYKVEISDDEIGYLAMHIGASLERYVNNNIIKKDVIIVCASGLGTSQFLKERIKKEFPNFNIVDIISTYELESKDYACDFILSTVPISNSQKHVINVSPILSSDEVRQIDYYVKGTHNSELKSFLNEKISLFQVNTKDKYEVIRILGELLYKNGYVDEGFVKSAIEREKLSSTAIGNFLAIPHAYQGNILKQGIAFLQLKEPINWGSEKVQLIFLLSIDMRSQSHCTKLFEEISDISKDYYTIERLANCLNYFELIKILK